MISFFEEKKPKRSKHCCETVLPCSTEGCKYKVYTLRATHVKNQLCIFCKKKKIKESFEEIKKIDYYAEVRY